MTWAHGLGAALLFLGSTAAGFALRRELQQRAHLLAAVIDSLQLLRSDIVGRLLPLPEALRHTAETAPDALRAQYTASQTASRTATGRFMSNGRRRSGRSTRSHRPRTPRC